MSSSGSAAPVGTLGTMNLKLKLLDKDQRVTVMADLKAQGSFDSWEMDENGILTISGTLDRIKVLKALKKHSKHVVVQRFSGS